MNDIVIRLDGDGLEKMVLAAQVSELRQELDKERKQKERAIKYLSLLAQKYGFCTGCKNDKFDYDKSVCQGCFYNDHGNWEWDSGEEK